MDEKIDKAVERDLQIYVILHDFNDSEMTSVHISEKKFDGLMQYFKEISKESMIKKKDVREIAVGMDCYL